MLVWKDAACALCFLVSAVCMVRLTCTDVAARKIEVGPCVLLGLAGLALQLLAFGGSHALFGAGFGLLVCLLCSAGARILANLEARRSLEPSTCAPLGAGDCLCLVSLSAFSGRTAPVGFAVFCLCAAAYALLRLLLKRSTLSDALPMAPFFFIWFVVATVLGLQAL